MDKFELQGRFNIRRLSGRRFHLLSILVLSITATGVVLTYRVRANRTEEVKKRYAEEVSKTYDFKFGSNPFAPGNATTTTGTFIPGEMFVAAKRCGTCHTDAHTQWRQSAHGNAFREPFYQKNVKDLQSQKGIEFTRHCESCHNPAALFAGALTKNSKVKRPFDDDGVSCISCHSIQSVNGRGIGGYVMGEPALLVKEDGTRMLEGVTDQQILNDVPSHRRREIPLCAARRGRRIRHAGFLPAFENPGTDDG